MTAKSMNAVAPNKLRRELGVASATALVAGERIALGIFLTPAGMAKALAVRGESLGSLRKKIV